MSNYNGDLTLKEKVITVIVYAVAVVIIIFLASGDGDFGTENVTEKTSVYSVDTQKGVQGAFALGYGGVGTQVKYYIYQLEGNKGKILKDYDARKTYIKDELSEEQDSYIETEYKVNYMLPCRFWQYLMVKDKDLVTYKGKRCIAVKEFSSNTLYVPTGYIKKQIDLSIK